MQNSTHLGPDGTRTYTHSIAETIDAIYSEQCRLDDRCKGTLVTWDAHTQNIMPVYWMDLTLAKIDPFHDTTRCQCHPR